MDLRILSKIIRCLSLSALLVHAWAAEEDPPEKPLTPQQMEARYLRNIRQVTYVGQKNGEAYFSADGRQIVFQGVREPGNPFYQIYRMDLASGVTQRVSTGKGRTTCAFFNPTRKRILFASTHLDPATDSKQQAEIEKLKAGPPKRYAWDFDPFFDIFESDEDGGNMVQLTNAQGYDAEGSYSPDGSHIVFCSMRDGDAEIYVMDADGKNQKRLTNEKGYDGGPFFSPDGKQIVWRHFDDAEQKSAEVWIMDADGGNKRQVTHLNAVSWAPYYDPTMKWIVFASNVKDPAFELYAIHPDGTGLTQLTYSPGFDGLPVISPDGKQLMWTSNRCENKSQIFIADLHFPDEKEEAPPKIVSQDMKYNVMRWRGLAIDTVEAANTGNLEHSVARSLHRAKFVPPIGDNDDDETFFIQGPSVAGRIGPKGERSPRQITLAATLHGDYAACYGFSAMVEAVQSIDMPLQSEILAIAADADELPRIYSTAEGALPKDPKAQIKAFISFANLGKVNARNLLIRGTGSSPQWREMIEHLAARHPKVHITIEDDPASAPELVPFVQKNVPSLAFTAPELIEQQEFDWEAAAAQITETAESIGAALDLVRTLAADPNLNLTFSAYDAAAAKAAATAAMRPYLGTVPEYKSEGVQGVKLSGVREGSPALAAGIQAGDVIVELDGKSIKDVNEYLQVLEGIKPNVETAIKVKRGDDLKTLKITPGIR